VGGGVQTGSTRHVGHWMAYYTCPGWLWWWWWWWRIWWNEGWQEKPKYSEKPCPSATLSTTNPTWPDPGSNPGRRGGKPATNRLSYGAAPKTHPTRKSNILIALFSNVLKLYSSLTFLTHKKLYIYGFIKGLILVIQVLLMTLSIAPTTHV
jgi:hypothetical protein